MLRKFKFPLMKVSPKAVTITLHGVQNSHLLFYEHVESMQRRGGGSDVICLDYPMERESLGSINGMHLMVTEVYEFIWDAFRKYDTVYLDGVSCGAKVFATVLKSLYRNDNEETKEMVEQKVVFNCVNGVLQPQDVKTKDFDLAKKLPYGLGFLMTPILQVAHEKGWQKEAREYGMEKDVTVMALNEDANQNIRWWLLKDQVEFMNKPIISKKKIRLKEVNVVMSVDDAVIDNDSLRKSAGDLFESDVFRFIEVPTKHSTLAYAPAVWRECFYNDE